MPKFGEEVLNLTLKKSVYLINYAIMMSFKFIKKLEINKKSLKVFKLLRNRILKDLLRMLMGKKKDKK